MLDTCERCGRWLNAGTRWCPNPACGGRVLPVLPQHTGRRWDLRGSGVGWTWPRAWDRANPGFRPPVVGEWRCPLPLQAAALAHGVLFAWSGAILQDVGSNWRSSLGAGGATAALLPFGDRLAVCGRTAIAALPACFLRVDLGHPGDAAPLAEGEPLGQAADPGAWVGWCRGPAGASLYTLDTAGLGEGASAVRVATPPGAVPPARTRIVMCNGDAWWTGGDSRLWQLTLATGVVEPVGDATSAPVWIWATPGGVRWAREHGRQITVTLPSDGLPSPAGAGPIRGVYGLPATLFVAGDRIVQLGGALGERRNEMKSPPGQWLDAAAVPGEDGEARLLVLTREGHTTALVAARPASGILEEVWRSTSVRALALLTGRGAIRIAHVDGLLTLTHA